MSPAGTPLVVNALPAGPGERGFVWARPVGWALAHLVWRARTYDAHLVPTSGPVLMAANHLGFADGPLVFGVSPRPVHFITKAEMFTGPFGPPLRAAGQIPIDRSITDRAALGAALSVLRRDGVVGVFPEGARGRGDVVQVRRGVAWLALHSGAPVVPVACLGTRRTGQRTDRLPPLGSRLHVVFGQPLHLQRTSGLSGRDSLGAATEVARAALARHVAASVVRTGQPLPDEPNPHARGQHHQSDEEQQ